MRRARPSLFLQFLLGAVGALALFIGLTLPARTVQLGAPAADPRLVFGAFHVHSNRSDGTGSPDTIAAAAARAGLNFVILTDHGDATRTPDPPRYYEGVLVIDAVEVGSASGHVVALGLERPSTYPIGGEAIDVIDDLHRLGGWVVLAHPDSPKPELRWRNTAATYEGLEWLNLDSEWRDNSNASLAGALLRYPFRSPATIASLMTRPVQTMRRWDTAVRTRAIVGLAGLDAHARVPWPSRGDPDQPSTMAAVPSYLQMFKTVAQAAWLERPPSGDGPADARLVLDALRSGRTYSAVTAFASPAHLTFAATRENTTIAMGESAGPAGGVVSFRAQVNDRTARVALLHNGTEIKSGYGGVEATAAITPGAYRIEAYRPGTTVPWIVSNPIYTDWAAGRGGGRGEGPPPDALRLVPLPAPDGWTVEKNATSTGTPHTEAKETRFDFSLGGGQPYDQFAALVSGIAPTLATEGFDRVQFTIRADRPMRMSVQLRLPGRGAASA